MEKIGPGNYEPLADIGFEQTLARVGHVNRVIEEVNNLQPVLGVYTALMTQSGTSAPTATVLQNTLGGTVVWSYVGVGYYQATLTGGFPVGSTFVSPVGFASGSTPTPAAAKYILTQLDANTIELYTFSDDGITLANGLLDNNALEIRVKL